MSVMLQGRMKQKFERFRGRDKGTGDGGERAGGMEDRKGEEVKEEER